MMLKLWRDQKAFIYSGALGVIFLLLFIFIIQKPVGLLDMRLEANKDKIIMATEAPDYIQVYDPSNMRVHVPLR